MICKSKGVCANMDFFVRFRLILHLFSPLSDISPPPKPCPAAVASPDNTPYTRPLPSETPSVIGDAAAAADSAIDEPEMADGGHHIDRIDACLVCIINI